MGSAADSKVAGKRPAARDDAHEVLTAHCGTGKTMGGGVRGQGKGRLEGLEGLFGVLGLDRPGGGPEEEAMPGAVAQQARGKVCVCRREENREGMLRGERGHTRKEGEDESKRQEAMTPSAG